MISGADVVKSVKTVLLLLTAASLSEEDSAIFFRFLVLFLTLASVAARLEGWGYTSKFELKLSLANGAVLLLLTVASLSVEYSDNFFRFLVLFLTLVSVIAQLEGCGYTLKFELELSFADGAEVVGGAFATVLLSLFLSLLGDLIFNLSFIRPSVFGVVLGASSTIFGVTVILVSLVKKVVPLAVSALTATVVAFLALSFSSACEGLATTIALSVETKLDSLLAWRWQRTFQEFSEAISPSDDSPCFIVHVGEDRAHVTCM
mmetsp:Transcript_29471/g.67782  ORF Transcript_29471/g.67782 Transcript_29471/m.67782 type:complete len:261 (-) Transcript_29471:2489-3271(-)